MRFDIRNRPDYASLHLMLGAGESVVVEGGSMMGHSAGVAMKTAMNGGLFGAAKRALGGESVFLNTFVASADGQRLDLAPSQPGDITHIRLDGGTILVQSGGFLAATPGIEVSASWGGARGFFSGAGLVLLKCSGQGDLFLSSYGAVENIGVEGNYVVDTSHIVAFDDTLQWRISRVGGIKSLFLGGEGLVVDFEGRGRVWYQTRNASALASFLHPFRPQKSSN
jgi:uncharacterized protein (TIGR00266 family)